MEKWLTNNVTNLEVLGSSPFSVVNVTKCSPTSRITNLVYRCIWNLHSYHHYRQNHSSFYQSHDYRLCKISFSLFFVLLVNFFFAEVEDFIELLTRLFFLKMQRNIITFWLDFNLLGFEDVWCWNLKNGLCVFLLINYLMGLMKTSFTKQHVARIIWLISPPHLWLT